MTAIDNALQLLAATGVGMVIGANRDLSGKPIGMRTLALVSLGAAAVATAGIGFDDLASHPDALSRVVQGIIQGTLTGIGFIGAGVILRDTQEQKVHGLTTAATVWVTAALGIACAFSAWTVVGFGTAMTILILYILQRLESYIYPDKE